MTYQPLSTAHFLQSHPAPSTQGEAPAIVRFGRKSRRWSVFLGVRRAPACPLTIVRFGRLPPPLPPARLGKKPNGTGFFAFWRAFTPTLVNFGRLGRSTIVRFGRFAPVHYRKVWPVCQKIACGTAKPRLCGKMGANIVRFGRSGGQNIVRFGRFGAKTS